MSRFVVEEERTTVIHRDCAAMELSYPSMVLLVHHLSTVAVAERHITCSIKDVVQIELYLIQIQNLVAMGESIIEGLKFAVIIGFTTIRKVFIMTAVVLSPLIARLRNAAWTQIPWSIFHPIFHVPTVILMLVAETN